MNTTRVFLEVEVSHHATCAPLSAVNLVTMALQFPAIQSVKVLRAETNYRLFQEPSEEFTPVRL